MREWLMARRNVHTWLILAAAMSPILVVTLNVVYTNHVQRTSNYKWCKTLNSIDFPGRDIPPGPAGESIRNIRELRHEYGCDR